MRNKEYRGSLCIFLEYLHTRWLCVVSTARQAVLGVGCVETGCIPSVH